MEEKIVKSMKLDNNQTLNILDLSRKIGEDAYQVLFSATMTVTVEESLFSKEDLKGRLFSDIKKSVGETVTFQYKTERNFIMDSEKNSVFKELADTFSKTILVYLSKEQFPRKLILKKYEDHLKT